MKSLLAVFTERRILVTLMLGFASGLPLALSGSLLQAWYTDCGLSLTALGFMGLAGIPYTFKFLWAPLVDRFVPPFLGRRRGWILVFQGLLCATLVVMAFFSPAHHPTFLFGLAFLLAFFSASQDIVVDAYRTDLLPPEERVLGASMVITGYRTAMLITGGLGLVLAEFWGFPATYLLMAALLGIGIIATLVGKNPENVIIPPRNFRESVVLPISDFFLRPHAIALLLFLICYELGNAFASSLIQAFLMRELHMAKSEIGTLVKFSGFIGVLVGSFLAGVLAMRWNAYRAMFVFGILQAVGNLGYLILFWTGSSFVAVGTVIFLDNVTGGMGQAALVGFLMSICNPRFSAAQYAGLSALVVLGRVYIGPFAGFVAENFGWEIYFWTSFALCIPGIYLLWWLKKIGIFGKIIASNPEKDVEFVVG